MEQLAEFDLTLVMINDEYHLYDLQSDEIYEAMSISWIKYLLRLWNKAEYCSDNCGIIRLII